MRVTYRIAHSLGLDAANQQMRAANRSAWNEQDAALAASTLNRFFPLCMELPGVTPELCGCVRCVPNTEEQMSFFSLRVAEAAR